MKIEDYNKYCIQGSDHYLLPRNEFETLIENNEILYKENQEFRKQLEVGKEQYNDLVEEKESLQEQLSIKTLQLEELKEQVNKGLYNTCLPYSTGYNKAIKDKKIQQQEFIKWLEDKIHTIETTYSQINGNYGLMNEKLEAYKEILQKYREIMNGDDNNGI
ncbi:MAG: hypothetical protein Q4C38_04580 [bacterium]|nr:hypothetical protein [bacterium]